MRNQSLATEKQLFPIATGLPRRPSDADSARSVKKGVLFALKGEFSQAAEDDESPAA
jgi:hypothetical protein